MKIRNKKIPDDEFMQIRAEVLKMWPTGRDLTDLNEGIKYHLNMPPEKNTVYAIKEGKKRGRTLVQPRAGVALTEDHIDLLKYLEDIGGADLLPTTLDSYTRNLRFKEAANAIEKSRSGERSYLNGYPAVNHGLHECRKVVEAVGKPLVGRPGAVDARLAAEIMLAAGYSDFEGGPLDYFFAYTKDTPLEDVIKCWQYVYRLVGIYQENGVDINQEQYGAITGTLIPPSLSLVVTTLEAIMAAEQGVRYIGLGYGQGGSLLQDVAALHVYPVVARKYLDMLGYQAVEIFTYIDQWMGAFPRDEARAMAVISLGSAAAAFGKADVMISKSPEEALGIPTREANAKGVKASKQILEMLYKQAFPEGKRLEEEKELIARESELILDRILELGEGDVAAGSVKGLESGILDIPFTPSRLAKRLVMPARDARGNIRFLDSGNINFTREIKDFHRRSIEERLSQENYSAEYEMVIHDVYAISEGNI